jgi:hypothetical protein
MYIIIIYIYCDIIKYCDKILGDNHDMNFKILPNPRAKPQPRGSQSGGMIPQKKIAFSRPRMSILRVSWKEFLSKL